MIDRGSVCSIFALAVMFSIGTNVDAEAGTTRSPGWRDGDLVSDTHRRRPSPALSSCPRTWRPD